MSLQVQDGKMDNCPLSKDKLIEVIQSAFTAFGGDENIDTKLCIKKLLESLEKSSSQYKFIVSITKIQGTPNSNEVSISNNFGASWNSKKDGLFNYVVQGDGEAFCKYLTTVVWVLK